ncbi:MAG: acyl carrier protein [Planctomycetia bacterium]|nr:acyl carrier protein [Planctomycetia bacterium]
MMATKEEIFEGVREVLVDALAVEEDEVNPESTLVDDLGAESIDLLDIVFNLEKKFEIKIDRGEMIPEDLLTNAEYVQEGRLTEKGLAELKERLPFANLEAFSKNPMVQNISKILTVNDMCHIVESKLNA